MGGWTGPKVTINIISVSESYRLSIESILCQNKPKLFKINLWYLEASSEYEPSNTLTKQLVNQLL